MNIVILGASGLIGHKLFEKLSKRFHNVYAVLHQDKDFYSSVDLFTSSEKVIYSVDAIDIVKLDGILSALLADVVLNCVGITKRKKEINIPSLAISTNSLFPHRLAELGKANNFRVIHFSTDCVFDGTLGNYDERSDTTGKDPYGKTKALGEIKYDHALTIRSSFIGRELFGKTELLEWFLNQPEKSVRGFTKAMYSGVSTIVMSKIVGDIIEFHTDISGLHQLATPEPISKYHLLCLAKEAFELDVDVVPDDTFEIKPTLNGNLLSSKMKLSLPSWGDMMQELAKENQLYR